CYPHLLSAGLLCTPFRERSSRGHAPLQGHLDNKRVCRNKTSEHSRRRCHCQVRAKVFTDLSQEWFRKFLELLLSDARELREFAFSVWTCPRHLAQRGIGKNNVSGDIALVRDLSPQRTQTLEEFFIAFDFASPWSASLLRRCLDGLG